MRKFINRLTLAVYFFWIGKFSACFRYLLYVFGYQYILPSYIIKLIPIKEVGLPLVLLKPINRLVMGATTPYLRKPVIDRLLIAINELPLGYNLALVFAYRDLEVQVLLWDKLVRDNEKKYPDLSYEEILTISNRYIAKPTGLGPHQTGAAIDILLVDNEGNSLDMGTEYLEFNKKTEMFSKFLSDTQRKNRFIMRNAMTKAGFCFYPGEWWHYSYGDQMWAAYSGEKTALFGPIELD